MTEINCCGSEVAQNCAALNVLVGVVVAKISPVLEGFEITCACVKRHQSGPMVSPVAFRHPDM